MKNFKIITFIYCLVLGTGCAEPKKNQELKVQPNRSSKYPQLIDSLNLQKKFDDAKWTLYLLQCDDTPRNQLGSFVFKKPMPISNFELRFDSLFSRADTANFYFTFLSSDNIALRNCNNMNLEKEIVSGIQYIANNDSLVTYLYQCASISYYTVGPVDPKKIVLSSERIVNPLQPDVITFLNKNKEVLHPWLYKEAVKRGVIKDSL